MLAFLSNFIIFFAGGGGEATGAMGWWMKNADPYLNYPGFEVWRFLNLAIFVGIIAWLLKKPLSGAFKAKREAIRADLIKAEEERLAAIATLDNAEVKMARLSADTAVIAERARVEAEAEKVRLAQEAETDAERMRVQAESEIDRKTQQVKAKLKRFSAEESIRLAEEKIKTAMNAQKDADLVKANIQSIGGMN